MKLEDMDLPKENKGTCLKSKQKAVGFLEWVMENRIVCVVEGKNIKEWDYKNTYFSSSNLYNVYLIELEKQ